MDPKEERSGPENLWEVSGRYSGLGLQWALSILLFLAAGWWVDGKIGTKPLFTIIGAFVGGAAGFYSLYTHLVIEPRRRKDESE